MPTPRPNETQDDFVSRCIPVVLKDGTADDQEQAIAICFSMWRERETKAAFRCECLDCGHILATDEHCADVICPECGGEMRRAERPGPGKALVMKVTKIQKLQNGRIRWQARANTGEFDRVQERFDQAFFDDVIANFYRAKEALSRGEAPPAPMTEPILDISHYSIYLPQDKRDLARAGWPDKMWRDGRALFAQGYFDDTRLGQLAAKAAMERKPEDRRVSIVVYPDYSLVLTENERRTFRGGNGYAWLDSIAMTATPCDPGAVMEVKSMSTIAEDARLVLGEDGEEIVAGLEAARTAKALPDGALVKAKKSEVTEMDEETTLEEQEEVEQETTESEAATEEPESEQEEALTMSAMSKALDAILPGIATAIDQRFEPLTGAVKELAAKSAQLEAQIKALATEESAKVKAALDSDGDWFTRMWGNSVQRDKSAVKGEGEKKGPAEAPASEYAARYGNQ